MYAKSFTPSKYITFVAVPSIVRVVMSDEGVDKLPLNVPASCPLWANAGDGRFSL